MAALAGLMIGSLWSLWPFKRLEYVAGEPVPMENVLPSTWSLEETITVGVGVVGAALVLGFWWYDQRSGRGESLPG